MTTDVLDSLSGFHPIISCEGTAEQVIVNKLIAADALIFPASDVIAVTRKRKAAKIQGEYLNYDYDFSVCVARVLDSRNEMFRLATSTPNDFE